jgi:citrate lyase subunit beta / citryl-CoA lyase
MTIRPRRSVLYMPGGNVRAIDKARALPVDGVILDLEDSVAPEAKEAARQQVLEQVRAGGFGPREIFIRVNGIDTPWHADDLIAAVRAAPDAILIPKVAAVVQLERIGQRLLDMKADLKIRIWAMIETPAAIFNILALAAEAHDSETRLAGFVMGTNDLARETRTRLVPGRTPMLPWLSTCLLAARAHHIDILDGVYNDITDTQGFAQECAQARDLGFDGKTIIHPSQIAACNAAFTPSAEDVEAARKIIGAFERPENQGRGVIALDGRMVERLHADVARRTVAIAEAIAARQP